MDTQGPSDEKKLTAEERLFRVIENGGQPLDQPEGKAAGLAAHFSKILGLFKKFPKFKAGESLKVLAHPRLDLAFANRILMALMAVGLTAAVTNTFFFKPNIGRVYDRVAQANVPTGGGTAVALRRPAEDYVAAITQRNLFQSGGKTEAKSPTGANVPPLPSGGVDEVLGNLQLVGIAWGVYPEAMIRDKKESRTHFVKQGQKFKDVVVKEILKDRVIVEYGGHPRELM